MISSSFRPAKPDVELVSPPDDSVSRLLFSPTADLLAVASWDNAVRIYQVNSQGQSQPKAIYHHQAPVLDLAWTKNGSHVLSVGCDNAGRMYDVNAAQGAESQQVAVHDAPIRCCAFIDTHGPMLVTASWDKTLKYWDLRSPNPVATVNLSERAYCMDTAGKLLVVGTADRKIDIINLDKPGEIWRSIDSPLKWQTRVISCFPTGEAYAVGSVEGRVAIQYPEDDKKNYSFKCHRYDLPPGSAAPAQPQSQNVFAVNTITFHKVQGTFCTGGSDGSLTFWDGVARTKLKPYTAKELNNGNPDARPPQWGLPIVSTSFNHDQSILAYALAYDWSKGHSGVPQGPANKIMLHSVTEQDVKKKDKPLGR